jgi:hypothetical protein
MNGKALIYKPGRHEPEVTEFTHWRDCTLEFLQKSVGGYIELIPHFDTIEHDGQVVPCFAYCNEEGKLEGLLGNGPITKMWNAAIERQGYHNDRGDFLVGSVVIIVGDGEFLNGHEAFDDEVTEEGG